MKTPRTAALVASIKKDGNTDVVAACRLGGLANQLETELQAMTALAERLAEALEASDECLALIEDVGHGAHMDNVSVARGYVQKALAAYEAHKKQTP